MLRGRGAEHRLCCAVQLWTLRATGRFLADYRRVPPEAMNHLAAQLGLDPVLALPGPERPATESAHLARVRRHPGLARVRRGRRAAAARPAAEVRGRGHDARAKRHALVAAFLVETRKSLPDQVVAMQTST